MAFLKYALVAASLLAPVLSQGDEPPAFPQITPGAGSSGECNGCYVVADVAAIVFGSEFLVQTDTVAIGIQTGKNGSYTRTSLIVGSGQLSISTGGGFGGSTAAYTLNNNPTVMIGSAALTSPTAYQVFTSYSVTRSFTDMNGNCITSSGSAQSPTVPFSVPIPSTEDANYIASAEAAFINAIGLNCSPGGQSVATSTIASGTVFTTTSTSIGPLRFTPQPISNPSSSAPTVTLTQIGTGTGNFSTFTGASISAYIPGGAGATLSPSFSKATLPLMAVGAMSILLVAWAL